MSTEKLFKLAARFEAKLAQQGQQQGVKYQTPPVQLQWVSALLENMKNALAATSKEQMFQFVEPAAFPSNAADKFVGTLDSVVPWSGKFTNKLYMYQYYPSQYHILKDYYNEIMSLYNKLIDNTAQENDPGFAAASYSAGMMKNPQETRKNIRWIQISLGKSGQELYQGMDDLKKSIKEEQNAPASPAPKTWGV
jgi:non-homologous end joining protein Ku